MELRVIEYFYTVVEQGSISAGASRLHISQPTLSRQLMDLEHELGVVLFSRGNRKITLTQEGLRLKRRAEEITGLVDKTRGEFLYPDGMIRGDIYIGAGETYIMIAIAQIIKEVQITYPNIRFHIYSGNADDVMERLEKGLLDFGILIRLVKIGRYEEITIPMVDTWGVLMRTDSDLASKSVISPDHLWSVPLIVSRQHLVRDEIGRWMNKDYNNLNVVATYNLIYNASLLVEAGIGYALVLDKLIQRSPESHLCFRPLEPKLEAKSSFVWKRDQVFSDVSQLFLERVLQKLNQ